jgi:hypothetical protein
MMHWRALQVLTMVTMSSPPTFAEAPPYEWTCKASGFYEMKVAPDGKATPAISNTPAPISIVISRRAKEATDAGLPPDMTFPFDSDLVVGVTGAEVGLFAMSANNGGTSGARLYFKDGGLREVSAMYYDHKPYILSLHVADKDWVFSIYSGSLTTDLEARHLNITVPNLPFGPYQAEADFYFLTGPCARIR